MIARRLRVSVVTARQTALRGRKQLTALATHGAHVLSGRMSVGFDRASNMALERPAGSVQPPPPLNAALAAQEAGLA